MKRACVLIVEDDFDSRSLLQALLSRKGFDVLSAENGLKALRLLNSFRPDVIVTDQMMPEMTGLELIRAVRQFKLFSETPILLLSAYTPGIHDEAIAAGATAVLEKPGGTLDLAETLGALLNEQP
ncbi:MAG TPA: response regulator [Blastocatellia bacterium]|nr:response regulator [Blastocatellia bacterium]